MKAFRQFSRILILCLLFVFVPIFILSHRLKHIKHDVSEDFVEDLSIIKHRTQAQTLSAAEEEESDDLKEPPLVVYKDDTSNSSVDALMFNEELHMYRVQHDQVVRTRSRTLDEKVKEMKDQVIRARLYLSFTPPNSSSHFVKELKARTKEVEQAINQCTKDSRLSRSALRKMRAMDSTLSKSRRIYPDCATMIKRLCAMTYNAEEQVRSQSNQKTFLTALHGRTISKGLHCLSMRLTSQYFSLGPEEKELPYSHKLQDPHLYHFAVFSDNILACAVVVNSTISSAWEPERIVFHIVTDSLNFPAMSMWFLSNPLEKATIRVESIENFRWLSTKYNVSLQREDSVDRRYSSELNHLRFYLPDVFPLLHKIVLLDHDVVVQRDLTRLWSINMKGKVNGAVETCMEGKPSFHHMDMFVNFTDPIIAEKFDANECTWAFGMNLFDLQEWRRQNLTGVYLKYLHLGNKRPLWKAGSLPIGWLTFYKNTIALDKSWHVLGLGHDTGVTQEDIDQSSVIHFDGILKPWLDIGLEKYKRLWWKHVKYEHPYLRQCNVHA